MPFKTGNELDVLIDAQAGAQGIARPGGMVLMVRGAIQGELVRARVTRVHKRYAEAELCEVLQPSPHRVTPLCPIAEQCGACQLQHMDYDAQCRTKEQMVADAFRQVQPIEALPILGAAQPWRYRNKGTFAVGGTAQNPIIGLNAMRSHTLLDVPRCEIQQADTAPLLLAMRRYIRENNVQPYDSKQKTGQLRAIRVRVSDQACAIALSIRDGSLPSHKSLSDMLRKAIPNLTGIAISRDGDKHPAKAFESIQPLWGNAKLNHTLCGLNLSVPMASFFQVNTAQAEALYKSAIQFLETDKTHTILDVYCGAGTLTLLLAQRSRHATGVELVTKAVESARAAQKANNVQNADFIAGDASKILPGLKGYDRVVVNPPRAGCSPDVLSAIGGMKAERIVYISCNPATLARDVKILCAQGYNLTSVQPVDLFPSTEHIETVAALRK